MEQIKKETSNNISRMHEKLSGLQYRLKAQLDM
jgi:hypothetical protein